MNQDGGTTEPARRGGCRPMILGRGGPSLQVNNRPRIDELGKQKPDRIDRIFQNTRSNANFSARRNEKLTIGKLVVSVLQDIDCRFGCDQLASSCSSGSDPFSRCPTDMSSA